VNDNKIIKAVQSIKDYTAFIFIECVKMKKQHIPETWGLRCLMDRAFPPPLYKDKG
jgi:hypothetical protein